MSNQQQIPQAVIDALMRGDKLAAIKLLREISGGDLKSAVDMVQRFAAQARQGVVNDVSNMSQPTEQHTEARTRANIEMSKAHVPTVMPGDSPSGSIGWLWIIAVVLLGWWWWSNGN